MLIAVTFPSYTTRNCFSLVKAASPQDTKAQVQAAPVPTAPVAARRALVAAPVQPEEEEDFTFDLDLNPGLLFRS